MSNLVPRPSNPLGFGGGRGRLARDTQDALERIEAKHFVNLNSVKAEAELVIAKIQARDDIAAHAAVADMALTGLLNGLPISDATDADFHQQLQQGARAGAIADLYRFGS